MKRSKFTDSQIAFILRQGEEGQRSVRSAPQGRDQRGHYYNWRKKYGGLKPSEMKRLRQLEKENGKLKQMWLTCRSTRRCSRT
jgi:putative transposase